MACVRLALWCSLDSCGGAGQAALHFTFSGWRIPLQNDSGPASHRLRPAHAAGDRGLAVASGPFRAWPLEGQETISRALACSLFVLRPTHLLADLRD